MAEIFALLADKLRNSPASLYQLLLKSLESLHSPNFESALALLQTRFPDGHSFAHMLILLELEDDEVVDLFTKTSPLLPDAGHLSFYLPLQEIKTTSSLFSLSLGQIDFSIVRFVLFFSRNSLRF